MRLGPVFLRVKGGGAKLVVLNGSMGGGDSGKSVRVSRDVFFSFLVLRVHRQTATSCCVDGYACAS